MPDAIVLDAVSAQFPIAALADRLRIAPDSPDYSDLGRLLEEARAIARPKAYYRLAYVDAKDDVSVVVDGIRLCSRVLRVNLESADRVFVHVATCGVELDHWVHSLDDLLWEYWGEAIKEEALRQATIALRDDQDGRYHPAKSSHMSPGSLPDWPLQQQRPLFQILGDVEGAIGVRLTSSMLMVPNKSTSGVRFEIETDFASCQLCPREGCPGRRAPYDPTLFPRRYGPAHPEARRGPPWTAPRSPWSSTT